MPPHIFPALVAAVLPSCGGATLPTGAALASSNAGAALAPGSVLATLGAVALAGGDGACAVSAAVCDEHAAVTASKHPSFEPIPCHRVMGFA